MLICDEPVSALDVSVQAQILNLLEAMKERYGLTLVFISHDLAVVKNVSDRVVVMYLGKLCEVGGTDARVRPAAHHYTNLLIESIPDPSRTGRRCPRTTRGGRAPVAGHPPSGCRFRTRCPAATERCAVEEPILTQIGDDHFVACHHPRPWRTPLAEPGARRARARLTVGDFGQSCTMQDSGIGRPLQWTTVVPLAALVMLALTWSSKPGSVVLAVVALFLAGAVPAAVHHAEVIAHRVGEPFGSLVLAVSVTVIEVALIVTLMVSTDGDTATLARDTVFAAVMLTCNAIIGMSLLTVTLRGDTASFNAEGTATALATVLDAGHVEPRGAEVHDERAPARVLLGAARVRGGRLARVVPLVRVRPDDPAS